jgi:hypothetical protein
MNEEEVKAFWEDIDAGKRLYVAAGEEEAEEESPYFNPDEIIIDRVDSDASAESDFEFSISTDEPMRFYIEEQLNLSEPGSPEEGYPILVFYTAKIGYGIAAIGVWLQSLAEYSELDMIADGWELLGKDSINLTDFRLVERIEIARQTHLVMMFDDYDNRYVHEYSLASPENVTEEQFDLIPPALQEFIEGINEMNSEIDSIDTIVSSWMDEDSTDDAKN